MKISEWGKQDLEQKRIAGSREAVAHANRREHPVIYAQDGSWICKWCDSSFNAETGEIAITDATLDDLLRIKSKGE